MFDLSRYYDVEPDAGCATWVVDRCTGPKNTLLSIVPSGFERYLRICPPGWRTEALSPNDEAAWSALRAGWIDAKHFTPVRWCDVAVANNLVPEREMQWFQISPPVSRKPGTAGIDPPYEGELTKEIVQKLFEILISFCGSNQGVICGFWEGFNRREYDVASAKYESYPGQQNYLLYNSTLVRVLEGWIAAFEDSASRHGTGTVGLAPTAIWPTSKDWYLTVPYNLRSSYIGGPDRLIQKISGSALLETYQALPDDNFSRALSTRTDRRLPQ